jgi:hypothetical protein
MGESALSLFPMNLSSSLMPFLSSTFGNSLLPLPQVSTVLRPVHQTAASATAPDNPLMRFTPFRVAPSLPILASTLRRPVHPTSASVTAPVTKGGYTSICSDSPDTCVDLTSARPPDVSVRNGPGNKGGYTSICSDSPDAPDAPVVGAFLPLHSHPTSSSPR